MAKEFTESMIRLSLQKYLERFGVRGAAFFFCFLAALLVVWVGLSFPEGGHIGIPSGELGSYQCGD